MIYEAIIVGSGPSGVAAAMGFEENGLVPLILDVGNEPQDVRPLNSNLFEFRESHDSFSMMIGEKYEGLQNLINKETIFPKLISPFMQFVTRNAEKLAPIDRRGFVTVQSFAKGGLANAWGAGLYRCLDDELINVPVKASDLTPYYDKLTREIGISGDDDDLTPFFGSTGNLLKPLRISRKSSDLYSRYKKKRRKLNHRGVYLGRPRLCVLSQKYSDRSGCEYKGQESWFPNLPYVYNPSFTLNRLIDGKKVIYRKSVLVKSWIRKGEHLQINTESTNDMSEGSFQCKRLILAAGTINSARIVLNSKGDFETKLPLLDNPMVQVPLVFPKFIGSRFETDMLGLPNLDIIFNLNKLNVMLKGSILELAFPLRSVFYDMLPLSARGNLSLIRNFLPSVLAALIYFPSSTRNTGYIKLNPDKRLEAFSLPYEIDRGVIREIVRAFFSLGVFTHSSFMEFAQPGYAIHYAGTLPMVEEPGKAYQCNKLGELFNEPNVFVVDGSLLSHIPAKNISFTLMANAMRIADQASGRLRNRR